MIKGRWGIIRCSRYAATNPNPSSIVKVADLCPDLSGKKFYDPGQCFIHRELSYRGIVLKSFPCTISINEQESSTSYLHLVMADSLDVKDIDSNAKLVEISHRHLGGQINDVDLVETSEMLPFKNGNTPIFNESIPLYFDRLQSAHICFDNIEKDTMLFNYDLKLKSLKYLQDQSAQTLQIMRKSYKKLEHMYDINSTITCFQLKANKTGTSNWMISVRLNESDDAILETARIEIIVVQEKIRMKSVDFPHPKGTVLQLNHVVKLREPDKAAFAFGIITYRKTGWPKEYRLRTNVSVMLPKKAMQKFKGSEK